MVKLDLNTKLKQYLLALCKDILPVVLEEGSKTLGDIVQDAKEEWGEFVVRLKKDEGTSPKNLIFKDIELLNYTVLKQIVREYRVIGANEAYVMKVQQGGYLHFSICYGIDKNPFDKDNNKFILLKADAVATDVLREFDDSDVIILK